MASNRKSTIRNPFRTATATAKAPTKFSVDMLAVKDSQFRRGFKQAKVADGERAEVADLYILRTAIGDAQRVRLTVEVLDD